MFKEFFLFEIRYRLRQPMAYVFIAVFFGIAYLTTSAENMNIGGFGNLSNVRNNSPYMMMAITSLLSYLGILLATAFMSGAALRDHVNNFHQIVFTTPVEKYGYLFGRFAGALVILMLPYLGAILGNVLGTALSDSAKAGPFMISAYVNCFLVFYLPNIVLAGALFYAVAVVKRSQPVAFASTIFLLFAYAMSMFWMRDLDNQTLTFVADPFGALASAVLMKYWTIADKNSLVLSLTGWMLVNRLVWLAVSGLILTLLYRRFSFTKRKAKPGKAIAHIQPDMRRDALSYLDLRLPRVAVTHDFKTHMLQFWSQAKLDFFGIVKSPAFKLIVFYLFSNLLFGALASSEFEGAAISYPVTYKMLDIIRGSYLTIFFIVIVYYAGVLVWRERDAKFSELNDASPFPSWVAFMSKAAALILMVASLCLMSIAISVVAQLVQGYTQIELGLYFKDMFLVEFTYYAMFCVLAVLLLTLINHRYIGYLAIVVYLLISKNLFDDWGWQHNLYRFGEAPKYTYSDFYGFAPYVAGIAWFKIYWGVGCLLLCVVGTLFWVRGKTFGIGDRLKIARKNITPLLRSVAVACTVCFAAVGSFVYYNTNVLNDYRAEADGDRSSAQYEKSYKKYQGIAQPKITDVKLNVEIFPERREVHLSGTYALTNKSDARIDSVHITTFPEWELLRLQLPGAKTVSYDDELAYRILRLPQPLHPGDSTRLEFEVAAVARGFENQVTHSRIVQNGTFLDNSMLPHIGYFKERELEKKSKRVKHGLSPYRKLADMNDMTARMSNDLGSDADWVTFEATLSTSEDQIAVAPGALQREWRENGRRYFHYKLEHVTHNFFSFISADYEVARDSWNGVDLEVYYHRTHDKNVPRMIASMKTSLAYYSEQFGPYPHKQARIIEFPRYDRFAQAFVGTMPYGESVGFIADLEAEDSIDMVYYIVAHEMGHQWWAHQVVSGAVRGSSVLSETLAQYSSLMVMEKEYGREKMREFLRYEMDTYLRGRGRETRREMPLLYNDYQPYIHYRKGSVVMYALREYIGEEELNSALAEFVAQHAYQEPPYTTSFELYEAIRAVTPDSLHTMLYDMFETITLYSNRVTDASYRELPNGNYTLYLNVESQKFRADSLGVETEIPVDDWIDIGVYAKQKGREDELIYLKREKIDKSKIEFEILLDTEPSKAGIDPNYLLIDRFPRDNIKRATSLEKEFSSGLTEL